MEDADAYYEQASSFQYITRIRTPCLFQLAMDDPFVRRELFLAVLLCY